MTQTDNHIPPPSVTAESTPALRACLFSVSGARFAVDVRGAREVALFEELFSRPEAYSWRISSAWARQRGPAAYLRVEVIGAVQTDAGDRLEFPYLLSGLLEAEDGTWRWRMCRGSEPAS